MHRSCKRGGVFATISLKPVVVKNSSCIDSSFSGLYGLGQHYEMPDARSLAQKDSMFKQEGKKPLPTEIIFIHTL